MERINLTLMNSITGSFITATSLQQLQNTDEIIENLRPHIVNISPRTYYRKHPEAVQALSSILWGYTAKSCREMLDKFFRKGNNKYFID